VTGQIDDDVLYRGEVYSLVASDGEPLFEPEAHGFRPVSSSTACWRGYVCHYAIVKDAFVLDRLEINHAEGTEDAPIPAIPPLLNGRRASKPRRKYAFFEHEYKRLGMSIPFTGKLLLGAGFIEDLYVHAGFQSAWKYRRIREVAIDEGRITSVDARTKEMSMVRGHILGRRQLEQDAVILKWVERYFSVDAPI